MELCPLTPGLVGDHCIGVDPYSLLHTSIAAGYVPDIIRNAREINDGLAKDVASRLVKAMILHDIPVRKAYVLIIGSTFKEDCPDVRNTKVIDSVHTLKDYGMNINVVETWADLERGMEEYELKI